MLYTGYYGYPKGCTVGEQGRLDCSVTVILRDERSLESGSAHSNYKLHCVCGEFKMLDSQFSTHFTYIFLLTLPSASVFFDPVLS